MIRVLLFGDIYEDKWLGSFIRSIKSKSSDIQIDFFNINIFKRSEYPSSSQLWSHIYSPSPNFPAFSYNIPKLRGLARLFDIVMAIKKMGGQIKKRGMKYDIVHISFLLGIYSYCLDDIKNIGSKIILTPWGSDILRADRRKIKRLVRLAKVADYVSCGSNAPRFREEIIRLLKVSEKKMIAAGFGTEMIDLINLHPGLTRDTAKKQIGLEGRYVIVCGYNANPHQQHLKIIESIVKIKWQLPENYILIFPMTYGRDEEYLGIVKDCLDRHELSYKMLNNYLSNNDLLYIRKGTDLFIHAQTTDANSGTVAEYLLCDTKVVNGDWLSYPQREKYGMPYYTFHTFDELGEVIITAIATSSSIVPQKLREDIAQEGWNNVGQQWVNFYKSCVAVD